MGLFDKTYQFSAIPYTPRNEQEAWLAIMHACIAVDEDVSDEELDELSEFLANLPFFESHDIREYYRTVLLAHARIGSKRLIDDSVDTILADNKGPVFAASVELLLADGVLAEKEQELIRYLTSALDLEQAVADTIVRRVMSHHKGLQNPSG